MDNFLGDLARATPAGIAWGIIPFLEVYGQTMIVIGTLVYLGLGIYMRFKNIKEGVNGRE